LTQLQSQFSETYSLSPQIGFVVSYKRMGITPKVNTDYTRNLITHCVAHTQRRDIQTSGQALLLKYPYHWFHVFIAFI